MGQGKGKEGKKRKNKAGYHLLSSQVIGMGKWGGVAAAVGGGGGGGDDGVDDHHFLLLP